MNDLEEEEYQAALDKYDKLRREVVDCQIQLDHLNSATVDRSLDFSTRVIVGLQEAKNKLMKMENELGSSIMIKGMRYEAIYEVSDEDKTKKIDDYYTILEAFKETRDINDNEKSKPLDSQNPNTLRSCSDRLQIQMLNMSILEDTFGGAANIAEEKREIAKRTEKVQSVSGVQIEKISDDSTQQVEDMSMSVKIK